MAVTSFYAEHGNLWLTSFGPSAEVGSEHTISIGHPLFLGEFTTYRLGPVMGLNAWGEHLFDLDEALVEFDGDWLPLCQVKKIVSDWAEMEVRGFKRGAFGSWCKAA